MHCMQLKPMKIPSTGLENTKWMYKMCCVSNASTRRFSGIEGYKLYLTSPGFLPECPWLLQSTPRKSPIALNLNFHFPWCLFFRCRFRSINVLVWHWTFVMEKKTCLEFYKHAFLYYVHIGSTMKVTASISQVSRHASLSRSHSNGPCCYQAEVPRCQNF